MTARLSLLEVFDGPFAKWRQDPDSWWPWRAFIKAITAEPLDDAELELYRACTGRSEPPTKPVREAWCVVGRRGRKSSTAAMIAVHAAVYVPWPRAPGETLRVLCVAHTLDQARLIRSYCWALLRSLPGLARQIVAADAETIVLKSGIEIKCVSNSFRSIRGPTCVCAILDEVALWRDENSANPDKEVLRAVKPSMLTAPGSVLIGISSPYAKRGLLYEKHRDHFGRDDSKILVWQAPTEVMNPAAPAEEIEERYRDDPVGAAAEYGAQFREHVATFLDAELLQRLVRSGPLELPPDGRRRYQAFVDPSGGRGDAFTCAIGHKVDGRAVVDCLRAWAPPFDPAVVTKQVAELLKSYGISSATGDRYAAEWCSRAFQAEGISYRASLRDKSELYVASLVYFTRGEVELPDDRRLLTELAGLVRRTSRTGKDAVDHPRGGSDDRANSVCGLLVELLSWSGLAPEASIAQLAVMGPQSAVMQHQAELEHGEERDPDFRGAIDWDKLTREGHRHSPRTSRPRLGTPGSWSW